MFKYKLIIVLLLSYGVCDAATFYVRTDGSNSSCNGSADASVSAAPYCAKQTIQAGVDLAYAGDTVIVRAGNYSSANPTFTSARAGTPGNLITIKAADGETVTVSRFYLNHSYLKGHGFRVVSSGGNTQPGIAVSADYVTISGNAVIGTGQTAIGVQTQGWRTGTTITGNIFEGSNTLATTFHIAIYLGGYNHVVTHNTVRNLDSSERIIEFYGDGLYVANNDISSPLCTDGDIHPDIFQLVSFVKSTNVIVENNYFHDFEGQIGNLLNGDPNPPYNQTNANVWTFRNNIFANISNPINSDITTYWYNNLFYNCLYYHPHIINQMGNWSWSKRYVYNNAFVGCGYLKANGNPDASNVGFHGGANGASNNFVSTISGGTKNFSETGLMNGGTLGFVAPYTNCLKNSCNFQLKDNSSMINKGIVISGFANDLMGKQRPDGGAWDIGPYEGIYDGIMSPRGLRIE